MADPWWVFAVGTTVPAKGGQPVGSLSSPDYIQAATEAAAEAATGQGNTTPPVGGPFATKAAAQAWVAGAGAQYFGTGKTNVAPPNDTPVTGGIPGPGALANVIPGLAQIGDFFAALGQASTWVRVGEVVLGLVLLAVGVARITHAVPIATKVAKTAGAVALA